MVVFFNIIVTVERYSLEVILPLNSFSWRRSPMLNIANNVIISLMF